MATNGWQNVTATQLKQMGKQPAAKPSKYRNVKTTVDGEVFDSKREAARWHELQLRERAGQISELRRQVVFALHAPVIRDDGEALGMAVVSTYVADFVYREHGQLVIEDSKGVRTAVYKLKRKHMLLEHGIRIKET